MAQLAINQCQTCGKILAPGVTECGKCHTKHSLQPTVVNPLRFTAAEAADYRAQFQEQLEASPKDSNAQFAMGLTYLGLRNYELADEHFIKAVQLMPSNPDVYYYAALTMFHHRSVVNLSKAEMDRIEEWLHTAVQIQPKRKYLILQMILRQGMSNMGINVDTDKLPPAELMKQARQTMQEEDELQEIEQHVLITDEKTEFLLNKLIQPEEEGERGIPYLGEMLTRYDDFCNILRENDHESTPEGVKLLEEPSARSHFFHVLHKPNAPRYDSKPGYFGPLWRSIWTVAVAFVGFMICSVIVEKNQWIKDLPLRVATVEERLDEMNYNTLKKKEKADALERAEEDYRQDSMLVADYKRFFFRYKDENGKQRYASGSLSDEEVEALPENAKLIGIKRDNDGLWAIALLLLSPLVWLLFTVHRFMKRSNERKRIQEGNNARRAAYEQDLKDYESRPSISDYKVFCSLFAGPNDTSLITRGDFVQEALRQAHISERDIQNGNGKIFFTCYLTDLDDQCNDCNDPRVTLREVIVRVCVAMRDSIVYMHGVWDTASDNLPIFDQERLLYSQIANFRNSASYSTLEVISHTNTVLAKIIYAYGNYPTLFSYQGLDPDDVVTYSTTRTSDFDEFYNSLIKMHTAYVKA